MATPSEVAKGVESLKNFERALGHVRNRYDMYPSEGTCSAVVDPRDVLHWPT